MGSTANLSQVIFKMSSLSSGALLSHINLKPEAYRVLTQVNGSRSVAEIAKNIGLDETAVMNIADSLFKAQILEVAPGSVAPPSEMSATAKSSQVIFKMSSGELSGDINLKPEEWRVLTQVNGSRSVGEIAKNLGLDTTTTMSIADSLFRAHILEVAPGSVAPPSGTVDAKFFNAITLELARAMGPLASMIVEDEVAALGETMKAFPRDRLADLVERVSESIKDNNKRLAFQRLMLEAIQRL